MLALALGLALVQTSQPIPEYNRGSSLYSDCLASVKQMDEHSDSSHLINADSRCSAHLAGFIDAEIVDEQTCFPEGTTNGTIIRLYVKYMAEHPKLMDEKRWAGLYLSIIDAYPCKKK